MYTINVQCSKKTEKDAESLGTGITGDGKQLWVWLLTSKPGSSGRKSSSQCSPPPSHPFKSWILFITVKMKRLQIFSLGSWGEGQTTKCLLCKHVNLSSDPQCPPSQVQQCAPDPAWEGRQR